MVALYALAADPTTGIIVNEVDQNGVALAGQTYDYNSCRIPWRAALDYLWFGTPGAKQATTKLTSWVSSVGFTVGAMSSSQATIDSFATYFVGIANDNGSYYGSSLRTLYLLTLSGNQWQPLEATPGDGGVVGPGPDAGTTGGAGDSGVGAADSGTRPQGDAGAAARDTAGKSSGGQVRGLRRQPRGVARAPASPTAPVI